MTRRWLPLIHFNRLQRKVLLVLVTILVPMLVTGRGEN